MSLLGIDIGSGSIKAVAFAIDGTLVAQAAAPYRTRHAAGGRAEAAPEEIWQAFTGVCRSIGRATRRDAVRAFAIASHGETIIPLGQRGSVLGPALMNADNRAAAESAQLVRKLGEQQLYRWTGVPPHPMYGLPKMMWLRRHAAPLYGRTASFVSPAGYALARLGLAPLLDASLAGRTGAFDLERGDWSAPILAAAGVAREKLPEVRPAGTAPGELSRRAAAAVGLPAGTVVVLAGHDQPCGALGAGCLRPGQVADSAGTYECLAVASESRPAVRAAARFHLNTGRHVLDGLYLTLAFFPGGVLTRWFLDEFVPQSAQAAFFREAEKRVARNRRTPTGICVLPHWVGACNPVWDVRATGVIVGLTPRADRWQLYQALFEGLACELQLNVAALEQAVGRFECVRIYGGNSRHPFSVQLRADITGRRFEALDQPDAVCLGAAMLAGLGTGVFRSPAAAVQALLGKTRRFTPDPVGVAVYAAQQRRYRAIYPALRRVDAQ